MAALALTATNTAPPSHTTPAFINMISLMLSDQQAPLPFIRMSPQPPVTSAAKIADAMIRSMLVNGMLINSASPADSLSANQPVGTSPVIPTGTTAMQASTNMPPFPGVATNPAAPLPAPAISSTSANMAAPVPAVITDPAPAPNQTVPARKQPRNAVDLPMTTILVTPSTQPITVPVPELTPPAQDPSARTAPITENPPQAPSTPPAPTPFQASAPESRVAFTAILTPIAIPATTSQIAAAPQPLSNFTSEVAPAPVASPATSSSQPSPVQNVQTATASQPQVAQIGNPPQSGGDQSSGQQNPSPETQARPASDTKIKPVVQQDDASQHAAPAPAVSPGVVPLSVAQADPMRSDIAEAPTTTPYNATAEALRTTESSLAASNLSAGATPRSGAAQEISIRIAPADSPAVDLRVVERSGQIHVDVRTPDATMQTSLRQDLGTLTSSLERTGYHAETFTPSSTLSRAAASAQPDTQQDPSKNREDSGDFSGGRRQQQQQKRPSTWLEDLEEQP
jgi:hypothetical protein